MPDNPVLVIGLGGTGQWALTNLKRRLSETYGEVPESVRLLAINSTQEQDDEVRQPENTTDTSDLTLDPSELVILESKIRPLPKEIDRVKERRLLASWPKASALPSIHEVTHSFSKGAGQFRQFGRIALFRNLSGVGSTRIYGGIEQALLSVASDQQQPDPIGIYIITSMAGSTGSGMVLDIAHMAQVVAEKQSIPYAITAFVVLPKISRHAALDEDHEVTARTFAAYRELERFSQALSRDNPMLGTDDPEPADLPAREDSKPIDVYYLQADITEVPTHLLALLQSLQ